MLQTMFLEDVKKMPCFIFYKTKEHPAKRASEAVDRRCSVKEVFLEISQNSQENTFARVSFSVNFAKFLRTFVTEHIRWLFLELLGAVSDN